MVRNLFAVMFATEQRWGLPLVWICAKIIHVWNADETLCLVCFCHIWTSFFSILMKISKKKCKRKWPVSCGILKKIKNLYHVSYRVHLFAEYELRKLLLPRDIKRSSAMKRKYSFILTMSQLPMLILCSNLITKVKNIKMIFPCFTVDCGLSS